MRRTVRSHIGGKWGENLKKVYEIWTPDSKIQILGDMWTPEEVTLRIG